MIAGIRTPFLPCVGTKNNARIPKAQSDAQEPQSEDIGGERAEPVAFPTTFTPITLQEREPTTAFASERPLMSFSVVGPTF